ncbi:MAG: transposase, partial [Candidatus Margulisiibacteriota bacterium]
MPYRIHPFSQGEIYHVFNRSIGNIPIFLNKRDYRRAIEVINFYNYSNPPLRFSYFNRLTPGEKSKILTELETVHRKQIDLLSFCLMPNHLHFLIKEVEKNGISTFMSNFQDSYAKYFNLRTERHGSLFQSMFKAVRIETEEQLLHVCR